MTDVWEFRLIQNKWNEMQEIAQFYNISVSMVIRYCLFKWIKQNRQRPQNPKICSDHLSNPDAKRCKVGFYGTDIDVIKSMANSLGVSISKLIRDSILENLKDFKKMTEKKLKYGAIKLFKTTTLVLQKFQNRKLHIIQKLYPFDLDDYLPLRGFLNSIKNTS